MFGPPSETPGTSYVTVTFRFGMAKKNSFFMPEKTEKKNRIEKAQLKRSIKYKL
jgi:hypothetical protein